MIWLLVVIILIVLIVSISKGNKKKNLEMQKLKKELSEEKPIVESSNKSTAEELEKLKELLDKGVLTPDEFESEKKKILT